MESRACDRCWTMKSQCDRRQPCSRCARLNIDCGTRRPQARRGRPRKQRGRSSRSLTTHSEDTTGSPGGSVAVDNSASSERQIEVTQHTPITLMDVLENAVELHTPTSRAALHSTPSPALPDGRFTCQVLNGEVVLAPVIRWLVRMSSQPQDRGMLSILDAVHFETAVALAESLAGHDLVDPSLTDHFLIEPHIADKYPAVSFALLAICMQMEYEVTSRMSPQRLDYMIDSLRVQCLKDIPALTWKSCETKIDHAKVLVLVSHFWCMKEDLALIADRWNSLASLINMEAMRVRSNAQTDRETDDTWLSTAIELQDVTLMLLHYRHRPVSERAWVPKTKPRSPLVQAPLKKTYFGLLRPLIRLLRVVLQDSDPGDSDVRDGLEQYYLCFPSDGLCYDSIRYIYEAEAMIWVHGIYILTYVPRDLSILLQDDHLPSQSDFYSGCEHSLLLAEVIPTLLRLDPELRYCSPATVQFVLISSTLTCTALRQFCPSLDLGFSRLLSPQPPENLLTSARLHSRFLRCLCKPATRFSSNLTQAVLDILDRLLSRDCECQDAGLAEALSVLSRYRWRANGSGIIPSSDDVALSEVGPNHLQPRPSLRLPALANAKDIAGRRAAIEAICRADVRVCTSGCFDLNIRFLSPPRHGAEDLLSSPVISVGFRLNSVDNQLLRKVIRRCRVAFEAGFDSGSHMVNLLLPHALKWPAILHGMLSLSTTHSWRALPELIHHQETLRALSEESELVQNGFYEVDKVVGVLGCQFLLSMFALSECNEWWAHHNRGMIDVVRAAAWDELQASSLGCFLSGVCAMSDISVFSIGGSRPSQWCWLEWMIPQDVHTRPTACPLDSITGYPRSLIDIIARVAASADMHCNEDVQWNVRPNTFPTTAELEGLLQSWKAPPSSPQTDPYMKLIIKTTWDCIRKAASILLWRGKGFHSNILTEYPRERKPDRDLFVNEILSDLQAVFEMVRGRQISIGNLTLWALTVVGCECGRRSGVKRSRDVAALLRVLGRDFAMDHALRVHAMLEALWDAESKVPDSGIDLAVEGRYLSLETVTREQKLEILLL